MSRIKRKREPVKVCDICSLEFFAESRFLSHLNSRGHKASLLPAYSFNIGECAELYDECFVESIDQQESEDGFGADD